MPSPSSRNMVSRLSDGSAFPHCGGGRVTALKPVGVGVGRRRSLPVGIGVAWVLARLRFPGKVLLDGLVCLPLVLPPVVTGYTLLVLMGKNGPLGSLLQKTIGLSFSFNWKGAALASAVMPSRCW